MDWKRLTQTPPSKELKGIRVLVSDGEMQCIARFTDEHWIFDDAAKKDMVITWWKELGEMPPIIVSGSLQNS